MEYHPCDERLTRSPVQPSPHERNRYVPKEVNLDGSRRNTTSKARGTLAVELHANPTRILAPLQHASRRSSPRAEICRRT